MSAVLISWALTRWVRKAAARYGWVRPPSHSHHIHERAIARVGGIAIYGAVALSTVLMLALAGPLGAGRLIAPGKVLPFLLPATLVFLLGVYDDLHVVSASKKFVVQIAAASLAYWSGFRVMHIPFLFGSHELGLLTSFLLTVLWIVGITNAFNLIDGLDGLAAGSAMFSILTVFVVSMIGSNYFTSVIAAGLAGAVLGFLPFNLNPATLFLGDSGSLFLGFMLSVLALSGSQTQKSSTLAGIVIPAVALGLPILDTCLAVFRRVISGQSLFTADCDHIHHRLLKRGFSHKQVVLILYAISAVLGLASLTLMSSTGSRIALVLVLLGIAVCAGVRSLRYPELMEVRRTAERAWQQKEIMANNVAVRRATDAMAQSRDLTQVIDALISLTEKNGFDGFELDLAPQFCAPFTPSPFGTCLRRHSAGWNLTWRKGTPVDPDSARLSGWKLTLELVTHYQEKAGTLALFRSYTRDAPRIDLGLFTDGLQCRLADALARSAGAHRVRPPAAKNDGRALAS